MTHFVPRRRVQRIFVPTVTRSEMLRRIRCRLFDDYARAMQQGDLVEAFADAEALVIVSDLLTGLRPLQRAI
jgi:hypothetical protein